MMSHGALLTFEIVTDRCKIKECCQLCAGLLRRGMVAELERVSWESDGVFCSISVTYDVAALLG